MPLYPPAGSGSAEFDVDGLFYRFPTGKDSIAQKVSGGTEAYLTQVAGVQEMYSDGGGAESVTLEMDGGAGTFIVSATGRHVMLGGDGIVVPLLAADPSGSDGQIYYNTVTDKFRGYVDGSWEDISAAAAAHATSHQDGGADEISIASLSGTPVELTNHLNDATDAHDASAISIVDAGTLITATEVEGALQEIAAASAAAHIADATDAHDASAISFTPAGTIAATNVQAAIEEAAAESGAGSGTTSNFPVCGRLTLTTAVPVTTADVTAATTLYFTPYKGNQIATYSGATWTLSTFTEKSITLATLTAGLPYDVFIVDGTLALELLAWTNATTRATALAMQDGILCKTGALTRRYLGTICIAATGQSEDSLLKRFVWNYYNRLERLLQVFDGTDSWTYGTATWRQARATAGNKVEFVCGVNENLARAQVQVGVVGAAGVAGSVGIGLDSTSAISAQLFTENSSSTTIGGVILGSQYRGYSGVGYHYLAWLEYTRAGTMTFQGDNGVADMQSGLLAEVWG